MSLLFNIDLKLKINLSFMQYNGNSGNKKTEPRMVKSSKNINAALPNQTKYDLV